ncbi:YfiR family protein [bacterium]|nr:YfiR family protein [bacterium]
MVNHTKLFMLIVWTALSSVSMNIFAQQTEYDVKAVLLWRISRYIEWPVQADLNDETEPFILAVIGKDPFGDSLKQAYSSGELKIKNRKVEIRNFSDITEIDKCHILFIASSEKKRLTQILSKIRGKSILIVGDSRKFGEQGVQINFYFAGSRIRFELNVKSVAAAGFKIDYRLRSIARIVGGGKESTQ